MNNPRAALLPSLFGLLGLLLAVAGCEKTNDVPRYQDEARATVKGYQERLDELARRAEDISKRGNTLRADALNSADAQRVYRHALTLLDDNRQFLEKLPEAIEKDAKSGDRDALPRLIDGMRERLDHATIAVSSELDAVESWIGVAEQQQGSRSAAPPPAAGTVPAGEPEPAGSDLPAR